MGRFIDDENFLALFDGVDLAEALPVGTIKILLHGVPTADVQPVVHAHWVAGADGNLYCSNCDCGGEFLDKFLEFLNYCPACGAIMDEEVKE